MDRSMIGRSVGVARSLSRGVPAPTLLVQQLEVSASTDDSPNQIFIPKDYRSMGFQAQSICNTLMDRSMIGTYVDVARFLLRGVPAPSLVQQLEVSASTDSDSQSQIVIPKIIAQWFFKPNQYAIP